MQVMGLSELCHILEVPEIQAQMGLLSPNSESADIQTFLSSPSGNSKRYVHGYSIQHNDITAISESHE